MSECEAGGVSISCEGGCGMIKAGNTYYCWCEPVYLGEVDDVEGAPERTTVAIEPPLVEFSTDPEARKGTPPEGPEPVTLCAHALPRSALVSGLQAVLKAPLEASAERDAQEGDVHFSGTLDETLEYLGLERAATAE